MALAEADLRYRNAGFDLRAEYARLWVINSYLVNDYLGLLGGSAVPSRGRGFYVQAGYNLLRLGAPETKQELVLFAGYENVDPRSAMSPYNYNPPTITPAGQTAARGAVALPELRARRDRLPAAALAGAQGRSAVGARRRGAAAGGADGAGRRARDAAPDRPAVAEAARGATRVGLAIGFAFFPIFFLYFSNLYLLCLLLTQPPPTPPARRPCFAPPDRL